jgi:hypothetical protein
MLLLTVLHSYIYVDSLIVADNGNVSSKFQRVTKEAASPQFSDSLYRSLVLYTDSVGFFLEDENASTIRKSYHPTRSVRSHTNLDFLLYFSNALRRDSMYDSYKYEALRITVPVEVSTVHGQTVRQRSPTFKSHDRSRTRISFVNCRPTVICQNSDNSDNIYMFWGKQLNLKLKSYLSVILC